MRGSTQKAPRVPAVPGSHVFQRIGLAVLLGHQIQGIVKAYKGKKENERYDGGHCSRWQGSHLEDLSVVWHRPCRIKAMSLGDGNDGEGGVDLQSPGGRERVVAVETGLRAQSHYPIDYLIVLDFESAGLCHVTPAAPPERHPDTVSLPAAGIATTSLPLPHARCPSAPRQSPQSGILQTCTFDLSDPAGASQRPIAGNLGQVSRVFPGRARFSPTARQVESSRLNRTCFVGFHALPAPIASTPAGCMRQWPTSSAQRRHSNRVAHFVDQRFSTVGRRLPFFCPLMCSNMVVVQVDSTPAR